MIEHVDVQAARAELDLDRRLREVPSFALVRGVFFHMIGDHLKRRGLGSFARKIVGEHRKLHVLYPVSELLVAFAEAAPLVATNGPDGVRQLFSGGSRYFAQTWFGKAFSRFIRPDPASALQWLEHARGHFCNYGYWRVEHVEPGHSVLHMFDEYIWIESAHRGGCEGLLAACGVEGTVEASLDTPFRGRLDVRWRVRS
jgi:uncharacterized protein (TIGR02265 family)